MPTEINHIETAKKNTAIAPGLTIVYWGREDVALINAFEQAKEQFSLQWRPFIWWYTEDHIHATLSALTRTKYGQYTPLKRNQLPAALHASVNFLSKIKPFEVEFSELVIRADGQIQFAGYLNRTGAIENVRAIRELWKISDPELQFLDRPKSDNETLHVNLGYFQKPAPGIVAKAIQIEPISIEISNVSIVHYLRRTLELKYVPGQYHLPLGLSGDMEVDEAYFYDTLYLK